MKKVFLTLFAAAVSVAAIAQTDVWVWKDGVAMKTTQADSITFAEPSFTDLYHDGSEAGYNYVDLGLTSGTRWATMNVGASKTQDYGNYYAWGETTTKETYHWSTYKYGTYDYDDYYNYSKLTKYNLSDSKTTLDLSDDAAKANWGGKWRIPTKDQFDELMSQCYWVWTGNYNSSSVSGYIVYKAKNSSDKGKNIYSSGAPSSSYSLSDAHIFLPAAGVRGDGGLSHAGSYGFYWSSSLDADGPNFAWRVVFYSGVVYNLYDHRYFGQSVRAVCPAE